jgi:SAM-dependent methyltransferase
VVSYKTYARRETHPARLGALGRLLGIAARDLAGARVLELGCGNGRNIIPLAEANPSTRFIGVDRATDLIEAGRRECAELGIENVELIAADIANYNPPAGEMDYVLCHGVYSWVSEVLQRRILDVIKKALAPNGIAVVSYNTLPGWHQRGVVRDIIRVGSLSAVADTEEERCDAGMKLLAALAKDPALSSYVRESAVRLEQSVAA